MNIKPLLPIEEVREIIQAENIGSIRDSAIKNTHELPSHIKDLVDVAWGKGASQDYLSKDGYMGLYPGDLGVKAADPLSAASFIISSRIFASSGGVESKIPQSYSGKYDIRNFSILHFALSKVRDQKDKNKKVTKSSADVKTTKEEIGTLEERVSQIADLCDFYEVHEGNEYPLWGDTVRPFLEREGKISKDFDPHRGIPEEGSLLQFASEGEIRVAKTRTAAWQMTQNSCHLLGKHKVLKQHEEPKNGFAFLADVTFKEAVKSFFLNHPDWGRLPENLFFTDLEPWSQGDCQLSFEEIRTQFEIIAQAIGNNQQGVPYIWCESEDDKGSFTVYFEEPAIYLYFNKDKELIQDDRGRFVQSSIIISDLHRVNGDNNEPLDGAGTSMRLLPPESTLMMTVLNSLPYMWQNGQYKVANTIKNLVFNKLPFCALAETGGATSGDRLLREKGVAKEYKGDFSRPWKLFEGEVSLKGVEGAFSNLLPEEIDPKDKKYLDKAIFEVLGGIRVHKNSMRVISAPVWELGKLSFRTRIKFLTNLISLFKNAKGKTLSEFLHKEFGAIINSEEDLDKFTSQLVLGDVTKAGKFTKRTELNKPVSSLKVKGVQDGKERETELAVYPYSIGKDEADCVALDGILCQATLIAPGESYAWGSVPLKRPANDRATVSKYWLTEDRWPKFDYLLHSNGDYTQKFKEGEDQWRFSYSNPISLPNPETGEKDWVRDQGALVLKDHIIAKVPYFIDDEGKRIGYQTIYAPETMVVSELVVRILKAGDKDGDLEIKISGYAIEDVGKFRGFLKTVPITPVTKRGLVDNEFNAHIDEQVRKEVQFVSSADGDKSNDNVRFKTDAVVQTLNKTEEGQELIKEINKEVFGIEEDSTNLPFDSRAAFLGAYDHLHKAFDQRFSNSIWLYNRDNGEFHGVLRKMFKVWAEKCQEELNRGKTVEAIKDGDDDSAGFGLFFEELTYEKAEELGINQNVVDVVRENNGDILIDCHQENYDEHKTHVFAFYQDDDPEGTGFKSVGLERAPAKVGDQETNIKIPVKQELSSPAQIVSNSPIMDVVARTVENGIRPDMPHGIQPNPELAKELMEGATSRCETWAAFVAMRNSMPMVSQEGEFLPKINIFSTTKDENGNEVEDINHEIKEKVEKESPWLISLAAQNNLKLKDLAQAFNKVVFTTGSQHTTYHDIHFPTVAMQEGMSTKSTNTFGGHLIEMFKAIILGRNAAGLCHVKLQKTTMGLENLIADTNGSKRQMRGKEGVYSKAIGHPGVKINKRVIKYAPEVEGSEYNKSLEVLRKQGYTKPEENIDGMNLILLRMPMINPCGLETEVAYPGHPLEDVLNPYQAAVNPLVCAIDAGDFDGDDRLAVFVRNKVQQVTVEQCLFLIALRLGTGDEDPSSCLNPETPEDYIRDWYFDDKGGSSFKSLIDSKGKNLLSKSLTSNSEKDLGELSKKSTDMQGRIVGMTHANALINEIFANSVKALTSFLQERFDLEYLDLPNVFVYLNTVLTVFELYEKTLGGYEEKLYELATELIQVAEGNESSYTNEEANKLVGKAGLNKADTQLLFDSFKLTGEIRNMAQDVNAIPNSEENKISDLLKVATCLHFLIGKGNYAPGSVASHLRMSKFYLNWNPELRKELEDNSLTLRTLKEYLSKTLPAHIRENSKSEEDFESKVSDLGFDQTGFDPSIGRENSCVGISAPYISFGEQEEDITVYRNLFKETPKFDEDVENLIVKLLNFLPRSRFGVKPGYEAYLRNKIAPKLVNCSSDQRKAVLRFFFDFFKKDKDGNKTVSPLTVLSGAAGTGKSFVARNIIGDIVENCTEAIWAPCGVSGVVCKDNEPTFASLFAQKKGDVLASGLQDVELQMPNPESLAKQLLKRLGTDPNEGRFVVFAVDEFAMASAHQLNTALETARIALNNWYEQNKEYYNFSFLLIGDAPQIQPVKKDDENKVTVTPSYSNPIYNDGEEEFVLDPIFDSYNTIWCGLSTNHRQGDEKELTEALNMISEGHPIKEGSKTEIFLNAIGKEFGNEQEPLKVFMTNAPAQKANAKYIEQLSVKNNTKVVRNHSWVKIGGKDFKVLSFHRNGKFALKDREGNTYTHKFNPSLFDIINSNIPSWVEPVMDLTVGQYFMFRQNDKQKPRRFVNGTVGIITNILEDGIEVSINNEPPIKVEQEWLISDNDQYCFFYGLLGHAAHALTIHKTQGLTLDRPVELILNGKRIEDMVESQDTYPLYGIMYTALSRVTKLENLSIKVDNTDSDALSVINKAIQVDPKAVEFRHKAQEELDNWQIPESDEEKPNTLYLDGEDDEGNIVISSIKNENSKILYQPATNKFTLIKNGQGEDKSFDDLPKVVKDNIYALCEIEVEQKRFVKEISSEAWGVSEPLGYVEYDEEQKSIFLYDKNNNSYRVALGQAEPKTGDFMKDRYGRTIYLGKAKSTAYDLSPEDVVRHEGFVLLSHYTAKEANTRIFESEKELKSFIRFLNRKPQIIEELVNAPSFLNKNNVGVMFINKDTGEDEEDDDGTDSPKGGKKDTEKMLNELNGSNDSSHETQNNDFSAYSFQELVDYYKELYHFYQENPEAFESSMSNVEKCQSLLCHIPQQKGVKDVIWDGESLWVDNKKLYPDEPKGQCKELAEYLNGTRKEVELFGKVEDGGWFAITSSDENDNPDFSNADFFDGLCGHPDESPEVIEKSIFAVGNFIDKSENENKVTNEEKEMNYVYAGVGSRSTPKRILDFMEQVAEELAQEGYTLRSGGAKGADSAFERGCDKASGNKRIYRPDENYESSKWEEAQKLASAAHESDDVTKCKGRKLLTRNVFQVLGEDLQTPVDFVICFCPLNGNGQLTGGTQIAAKVAKSKQIPVFNLQVENPNEVLSKIKELIRNKK